MQIFLREVALRCPYRPARHRNRSGLAVTKGNGYRPAGLGHQPHHERPPQKLIVAQIAQLVAYRETCRELQSVHASHATCTTFEFNKAAGSGHGLRLPTHS